MAAADKHTVAPGAASVPATGQSVAQLADFLTPRVLWVLGALCVVMALYKHSYFLHDDSMISLRFARNLLDHGVLDWNIGERVEGYTNFLHILATVAVMKLGVDPVVAVRFVNVLAVGGLLWSCWQCLRLVLPQAAGAQLQAFGMMLVLATSSVVVWMLGGLETVMVAALLTAGFACLLPAVIDGRLDWHRALLGGVLFGAAVATRPDAAVAATALVGGLLLAAPMSWSERLRLVVLAGAGGALVVLPHLAWRWSYYGDLLPNTFYAKVGVPLSVRLASGLPYITRALIDVPALLLGVLLVAELALKRRATPLMAWIAAAIGLHVLYVIWAGGDHMAGGRLLLPIVGLGAVLAALALAAMPAEDRTPRFVGCVALGLLQAVLFPPQEMDRAAYVGQIVGEHLSAHEKPGTLVALNTAGSTPYFAPNLRFIDMLGLVDRKIARRDPLPLLMWRQRFPGHAKGDGLYVLSRKPGLIILGPSAGALLDDPWFLSDQEIVTSAEFKRCYRLDTAALKISPAYARLNTEEGADITLKAYRRTCAG